MKEFTKGDKDGLRVFEKNITTRQNRAGVIREINGIHASKKFSLNTEVALYSSGQNS